MVQPIMKEAASVVSTLAKDFLAIGGRLMLDPNGRYECALDAGLLFERVGDDPAPYEARRVIAGRFVRAERSHAEDFGNMARQYGRVLPHGWTVWEAQA